MPNARLLDVTIVRVRCTRKPWCRRGRAAALVTLLAATGCADALAARPRAFGPAQIVGHIGHALPFDARPAVADDGRAAVLWARSPQPPGGTAIELATAKPGARFSRPETIAHVPFGPIEMALAISNSGEVIVALAPESPGGLEVVVRSANATLRPPHWIVRPPVGVLDPSIAVGPNGSALLAWRPVSAGDAVGATAIGAAWRERGRARFGRPLSLGSMRYASPPQALFVASGRGAIGFTRGSAPDPAGGLFTDARVAFADVGRPFGAPLVLSNTATAHTVDVGFAPDGEGGVFATWRTLETLTLVAGGSLWATHVTSSGPQQPPQRLAFGNPIRASLSAAGHDRAILVWGTNAQRIDGAELGPGLASPFTNDVPDRLNVPPSVAVDGAGAGVVAWAHRTKAPTQTDALGLQQIRYATIPPGAHAFCPPQRLGRSTVVPQIAIGRSGGLILWIGTRSAAAPIEVARWNAASADRRGCP